MALRTGPVGLESEAGVALHRDWARLAERSVRSGPDQRRGLPVECLSCAADRASVRTDRFGGRLTVDSELARTKGIRLSN